MIAARGRGSSDAPIADGMVMEYFFANGVGDGGVYNARADGEGVGKRGDACRDVI